MCFAPRCPRPASKTKWRYPDGVTYGALAIGSLLVGAGVVVGVAIGRSSVERPPERSAARRRIHEVAERAPVARPTAFAEPPAAPPSEVSAPEPLAFVPPPGLAPPPPGTPSPVPSQQGLPSPAPSPPPPVVMSSPQPMGTPSPQDTTPSRGRVFNGASITSSSFDQEDVTDREVTRSSWDDADRAPDEPLTRSSFDDQDVTDHHPTGP
jgi:hypothetical protein